MGGQWNTGAGAPDKGTVGASRAGIDFDAWLRWHSSPLRAPLQAPAIVWPSTSLRNGLRNRRARTRIRDHLHEFGLFVRRDAERPAPADGGKARAVGRYVEVTGWHVAEREASEM